MMRAMMRAGRRGFTLIEVVIALTISATLLVVLFAGLRVGLAAWQRGDERAEALQRTRSITQILTRSLGATYPYRASATVKEPAHLLFEGEPGRLAFVTSAAPFPAAEPIAYTAVSLAQDPEAGLAIRQKVLPNEDPFERLEPAAVDGAVTAIAFRYLTDDSEHTWTDRWDAATTKILPLAIEVTLTTGQGARSVKHPPLMITLRVPAS
jgi:general secretion pathway protein J